MSSLVTQSINRYKRNIMAPLSNTINDDKSHYHNQYNNYETDLSTCFSDEMSVSTNNDNQSHPPLNSSSPSPMHSTIRHRPDSPSLLTATFSNDDLEVDRQSINTVQTSCTLKDQNSSALSSSTSQHPNDFFPRLTLTMSDKPVVPPPSNSSVENNNANNESNSNESTSNNNIRTTPSRSGSVPPSPRNRRQISLSLSIPPKSPIPAAKTLLSLKSKQAKQEFQQQTQKLQQRIRTFRQKRQERREERIKQKKLYRLQKQQQKDLLRKQREERKRSSSIIVIPSNHSLKLLWDALTILLTFVSAMQLHIYIRDRSTYDYDAFSVFSNVWFGIDLLMNFITDHRTSDGTVIRTGKKVWGRYLTTWFAVDALSLLPWERMFIRPIILMQNRRNIVTKWFFRSKGVVKVTRYLGKRKFLIKYFKKVSKETKKVGVGASRLIRLLIKYIPKYLLFYRNMKGVLLLKTLRQVHYLKKLSRGLTSKFYHEEKEECNEDDDMHDVDDDDDDEIEEDDDEIASVASEYEDLHIVPNDCPPSLELKFNFSLDDNRMSSLHCRNIEEMKLDHHVGLDGSSQLMRRPHSTRASMKL